MGDLVQRAPQREQDQVRASVDSEAGEIDPGYAVGGWFQHRISMLSDRLGYQR